MNNSEEPIYDFANLKRFLERRGYRIGTRKAYEIVKPEDVKPEDVSNGSMEFRPDGIFVIGKDGVERQVFLYKKDYHLMQYGKPRFHICRCSTIDEFINNGRFKQHYVRANTEPVPVIDLDDGREQKDISGLPLCRYCIDMLGGYNRITSSQFVELLKAANGGESRDKEIERDLFGYTRDWDVISKEYREQHNYTCENCGIKIEDDYDKQYMHVHHINGDKLDNDVKNLKCLCLYCHAHVDNHHLKRLTSGANRVSYCSFVDRYGEDGYWDIKQQALLKARNFMRDILQKQNVVNITIENHYHGEINQLTINSD